MANGSGLSPTAYAVIVVIIILIVIVLLVALFSDGSNPDEHNKNHQQKDHNKNNHQNKDCNCKGKCGKKCEEKCDGKKCPDCNCSPCPPNFPNCDCPNPCPNPCPTIPPCPQCPACICPDQCTSISQFCSDTQECCPGLVCGQGNTCDCPKLLPPELSAQATDFDEITASWTVVPGATSYHVFLDGPTGQHAPFFAGTNIVFSNLSPGIYVVTVYPVSLQCGADENAPAISQPIFVGVV